MSRKHGRKHEHNQTKNNHPSEVQRNLPSGASTIEADAPRREDVQETTKKNLEPKMVKRPDWITIFTGVLALFAALSFGALWMQLRDARESFTKDQRPYIWTLGNDVPTVKLGEKVLWNFRYSNFGKSPAMGVAFRCQIRLQAHNTPEMKDFVGPIHKPGLEYGGTIIPPTDNSNWATCESEETITEADIKMMNTYDVGAMLVIYFEYFDIGRRKYASEVCKFTRRPNAGVIGICPDKNRIW